MVATLAKLAAHLVPLPIKAGEIIFKRATSLHALGLV
jgi:hypothetical protein